MTGTQQILAEALAALRSRADKLERLAAEHAETKAAIKALEKHLGRQPAPQLPAAPKPAAVARLTTPGASPRARYTDKVVALLRDQELPATAIASHFGRTLDTYLTSILEQAVKTGRLKQTSDGLYTAPDGR